MNTDERRFFGLVARSLTLWARCRDLRGKCESFLLVGQAEIVEADEFAERPRKDFGLAGRIAHVGGAGIRVRRY